MLRGCGNVIGGMTERQQNGKKAKRSGSEFPDMAMPLGRWSQIKLFTRKSSEDLHASAPPCYVEYRQLLARLSPSHDLHRFRLFHFSGLRLCPNGAITPASQRVKEVERGRAHGHRGDLGIQASGKIVRNGIGHSGHNARGHSSLWRHKYS